MFTQLMVCGEIGITFRNNTSYIRLCIPEQSYPFHAPIASLLWGFGFRLRAVCKIRLGDGVPLGCGRMSLIAFWTSRGGSRESAVPLEPARCWTMCVPTAIVRNLLSGGKVSANFFWLPLILAKTLLKMGVSG